MKTAHIYSPGYALLAGLLLTASTGAQAVDNNLHFYGNLLSKSCTLVVDGANLAEIHFPTVSNRDLMVSGQSAHLPVVFKLKDCKGPAGYNVKVTLSGTEDSGQPGFLAVDDTSTAQGVGIGMERSTASGWILTTPPGRPLRLPTATMILISGPGSRRKAVVM